MYYLRWLPCLLLLVPWLLAPASEGTDTRIRDLSGPSSFSLLDWETTQLGQRLPRLWSGLTTTADPTTDDAAALRSYFRTPLRDRVSQRPVAEAAMERVIGAAYRGEGVLQAEPPWLPSEHLFPPLLVALTTPPDVLVISPRTELRVQQSAVLKGLDVAAQQQLEASADSLGVSSLVAPIGGLATYPSMVLDDASAERVLSSVAHEWVHQYLIFYPLGRGYWQSQQTREINETAADLIGTEIGRQVARNLDLAAPSPAPPSSRGGRPSFDFNGFMRETRGQVEQLLQAGQVDEAEQYMRDRRDELQTHGYQIRKLNQAYFALYGSYGDGFAASPRNPIAGLLRTVRQRSATLGDFLVTIRRVTSVAELSELAAG
jgi:hypothetical protein